MSSGIWDTRYGTDEYAYGKEPNDFLRSQAKNIPAGRVLCLAEGEGRNAVYLAGLGYAVTAVDLSAVGLRKAERLADEYGVKLELVEADLAIYEPGENLYAGVVSIFAHFSPSVRHSVYRRAQRALIRGGAMLVEAYSPQQLRFGSGGPKDPTLLATLNELTAELPELELTLAHEVEREVREGAFHTGHAATVQIIGFRRS